MPGLNRVIIWWKESLFALRNGVLKSSRTRPTSVQDYVLILKSVVTVTAAISRSILMVLRNSIIFQKFVHSDAAAFSLPSSFLFFSKMWTGKLCHHCLWQMSPHYFVWVGVYLIVFGLPPGQISSSWLRTFLTQSFQLGSQQVQDLSRRQTLLGIFLNFSNDPYITPSAPVFTILSVILTAWWWKKASSQSARLSQVNCQMSRLHSASLWGDVGVWWLTELTYTNTNAPLMRHQVANVRDEMIVDWKSLVWAWQTETPALPVHNYHCWHTPEQGPTHPFTT